MDCNGENSGIDTIGKYTSPVLTICVYDNSDVGGYIYKIVGYYD